jgi:hypothetical protein
MAKKAATTYARHYRALEEAADRLRIADVSDMDDLLAIVEKAARAHRACGARLDAVAKMLDEGDAE